MIRGSILYEVTTILNVYASNRRASKYIGQKLMELKGETDKSTLRAGNLNTALSVIDILSRQRISKYVDSLNSTIN